MANALDSDLCPIVEIPPPQSSFLSWVYRILISIGAILVIPVLALYCVLLQRWKALADIWHKVMVHTPLDLKIVKPNRDKECTVWSKGVGALYAHAVEYQLKEGYCSATTLRCVLKSINASPSLPPRHHIHVPPTEGGSDTPEGFKMKLDAMKKSSGESMFQNVSIVRGADKSKSNQVTVTEEDHYEAFLAAIKLANNPRYRIVCNFLRGGLFGPVSWAPDKLLLALLGGHFSPIIGWFPGGEGERQREGDTESLCALFDVNPSYSLVLVPPRKLFNAVRTLDLITGLPRGLIVVELKDEITDE